LARELREQVDVAGDQEVLRDHADRVSKLEQYLQTAPSEPKATFRGLVAIRGTAQGDHLWFPFRGCEGVAQQCRRVPLHHDLGLEIEAAAPAQVLVIRAGVAVRAAV